MNSFLYFFSVRFPLHILPLSRIVAVIFVIIIDSWIVSGRENIWFRIRPENNKKTLIDNKHTQLLITTITERERERINLSAIFKIGKIIDKKILSHTPHQQQQQQRPANSVEVVYVHMSAFEVESYDSYGVQSGIANNEINFSHWNCCWSFYWQ